MADKSNITTTDWLIRGISPKKLAKEKAKAIKSAHRELARREKKIEKEKQRILKRLIKADLTYEEVMGIVETYLLKRRPFDVPDEIIDKLFNIPHSELIKIMENQDDVVGDTIKKLNDNT